MPTSGEWAEGKGDRAHLSSLFRAEALGHQIQETRQTGSRAPWRASEEGSPDHFRRNPSFSSSGCPGSQPLFLSLAKQRVGLGDLECRAQAESLAAAGDTLACSLSALGMDAWGKSSCPGNGPRHPHRCTGVEPAGSGKLLEQSEHTTVTGRVKSC